MRRSFAKAVVVLGCAVGANTAWAQDCVGFTDVSAANTNVCNAVEWIKNRSVTLGCTSTTLFCPTNSVTREQMALFMQRLGKALTTEVLKDHVTLGASTIPGESPQAPLVTCDTGVDSTVAAYPRQAMLQASVTGLADGNPVAWRAFWRYSTDGGQTYQAIMDGLDNISSPRASSAGGQWSGAALAFALDLPANTPLRMQVAIRRDNVLLGTTGNFAQVRCQMTVGIVNANGTTSPL